MRRLVTAFPLLCLLFVFSAAQGPTEKSDLLAPVLISKLEVKSPPAAKKTGLGGRVMVLVSVDIAGNVSSVDRIHGPGAACSNVMMEDVQALRETARSVALQAKFKPATRNGVPENAPALIEFVFKSDPSNPMNALIQWTDENISKFVSGGGLNQKARHLPVPVTPTGVPVYGTGESVRVEVLIDENGDVFLARVLRGNPHLIFAALEAACEAKFGPTFLDGNPVKVSGVITYSFIPN